VGAPETRTSDPLIKSQGQRGPEPNIDKKAQTFRNPLAFSSTMEGVCSGHVQAQNKHSRARVRREREMNKRKLGSLVLCVMLTTVGLPAEAQQTKKVPRIGFMIGTLSFHYPGPNRRVSAGSARAWLRGGEKHCH